MNLETLVSPWVVRVVLTLVSIGVYVGFVLGLDRVLDYFFGYKIANRTTNVIGFPIIVCLWIWETIRKGLTWPWRHRNQRLLKEIFGVPRARNLNYDGKQKAQKEIDTKLGHLAYYLKTAFDRQEEARNEHRLIPELEANDRVNERKKAFWHAHGVARKGGYEVRERYSDYL